MKNPESQCTQRAPVGQTPWRLPEPSLAHDQIADRTDSGDLRQLAYFEKAALRSTEPLRLIDEASAETLEPLHLITQAVRACDGEAIDIEDSDIR